MSELTGTFEEVGVLLDSILSTPTNHRKIIFWYDENTQYTEYVKTISKDDLEVIIYENNSFWIRYHLEYEQKEKDVILYIQEKRKNGVDNNLLDLYLINKDYIFNPNIDSVRLKNLGLGEDSRYYIQSNQKFFGNRKREDEFKKRLELLKDNNINHIICSILLGIKSVNEDEIFKNIIKCFINDDKKKVELLKFGNNNFILDLFNSNFIVNSNVKLTSIDQAVELLKSIIFTHFASDIENNELVNRFGKYIIKDKASTAYVFTNSLMSDVNAKCSFEKLSLETEIEFDLETQIKNINIDQLINCDTFKIVDFHILNTLCSKIDMNLIDFDYYKNIIQSRKSKYWYNKFENEYCFLLESINFFELTNKYLNNIKNCNIETFVKNYIEDYSLIDTSYRKVYYYFDKLQDVDNFLEIKESIESIYTNEFISNISVEWSKMLLDLGSYNSHNVPMQNTFYNKYLKPSDGKNNRTFVIISDGMRYEVANELNNRLKQIAVKSDIENMLGVLPSYTKLGMASLLPNNNIKIDKENDKIFVDEMPCASILERNAILVKNNEDSMAIHFDDIYDKPKNTWKKLFSGKKIIYIYHDVIDNAGEHNESKVFDACGTAIDEIEKLIIDLNKTLCGINALVTSDHGFYYKRSKLEKHDKTKRQEDTLTQKTRYSYTEEKTKDEGILSISLDYLNNTGFVNVPKGNIVFSRQGTGFNYIHGGSLPQEIIIPVINFKTSKTTEAGKPVGITYSGLSSKITNTITYLEFLQDSKVDENNFACRYLLHFEDDLGNRISDQCTIVADYTLNEVGKRLFKEKFVFKSGTYPRENKYYLIIKNENTDVEVSRKQFTIDIAFTNIFGI